MGFSVLAPVKIVKCRARLVAGSVTETDTATDRHSLPGRQANHSPYIP